MVRVHHLNCGTLRPFGRRLVNGDGTPFQLARLVCHCLLVETDEHLVLVDTGFGLGDVAWLRQSLARAMLNGASRSMAAGETPRLWRERYARARFVTRARAHAEETAVRQVARLGYEPGDVGHVVMTHLDLDHAGGLADFPNAKVHVLAIEHQAAMSPPTPGERTRYWSQHWAHGPDWITYDSSGGDQWFGFDRVRELDGLPDMALIPLPGHTRGHAGVAIRADDRWVLHAGDAYFYRGEVDPVARSTTRGLAGFQARMDVDRSARRGNQERLRELAAAHGSEISMFCSHDPVEFDRESEAAQRNRRSGGHARA